jgi:hypothetical protein
MLKSETTSNDALRIASPRSPREANFMNYDAVFHRTPTAWATNISSSVMIEPLTAAAPEAEFVLWTDWAVAPRQGVTAGMF